MNSVAKSDSLDLIYIAWGVVLQLPLLHVQHSLLCESYSFFSATRIIQLVMHPQQAALAA